MNDEIKARIVLSNPCRVIVDSEADKATIEPALKGLSCEVSVEKPEETNPDEPNPAQEEI